MKRREFFRPAIFHLLTAAVNKVEDGQLKVSLLTRGGGAKNHCGRITVISLLLTH